MLARLASLVAPALCVACGADAGAAAPLCRECRAWMNGARARVDRAWTPGPTSSGCAAVWAAFAYDGPAGALVRALKFRGRCAVADVMAAQIAALAPPGLLRGTVVPVPVHPRHRRRRGLDHSGALGRALAARTGLAFADCLTRSGDPRPQVGRGRAARVRGPAGSIAVRSGVAVPDAALLVDDVVTTGATLAACVRALANAGTEQISPIAYARTTAR